MSSHTIIVTLNETFARLQPRTIHPFDALCVAHGIDHRTTQFRHPWTNGQVEITNKVIKNATTKAFHYDTVEALKQHLMVFLLYYNHQRPLKALKFKPPWQVIEAFYHVQPAAFLENPLYKIVGFNNY